MKKFLLLSIALLSFDFSSNAQFNYGIDLSDTSQYYIGYITGQRIDHTRDVDYREFYSKRILFSRLDSTHNDGAIIRLVGTDNKGNIKVHNYTSPTTYTAGNGITISSGVISRSKRQETYTGNTAATVGTYTVTFGTAYSVAPNVQVAIQGDFASYTAVVSAKSTTGFTVKVYTLSSILSLGLVPQYSPVGGVTVDVLVTEK